MLRHYSDKYDAIKVFIFTEHLPFITWSDVFPATCVLILYETLEGVRETKRTPQILLLNFIEPSQFIIFDLFFILVPFQSEINVH